MDGRKHPTDPDPTWYGHSIGWWEGDTLVIDKQPGVPMRPPLTARRGCRSLAAAAFLAFAAMLWPAPAVAQIEEVTIGVDGMT